MKKHVAIYLEFKEKRRRLTWGSVHVFNSVKHRRTYMYIFI